MGGRGTFPPTLAANLLRETGLDESLAEEALSQVESVTGSKIWKRAMEASERYAEIPFQVLLDIQDGMSLPTVIRGSIDLVFKERDGWVLNRYRFPVSVTFSGGYPA